MFKKICKKLCIIKFYYLTVILFNKIQYGFSAYFPTAEFYRAKITVVYKSDEIIAMKDGKILAKGTPEDIITEDILKQVYGISLLVKEIDNRKFVITVMK